MLGVFIKVKAKSKSGDYLALISVEHISSVLESTVGCQIVCKNGDIIPVKNEFSEVEKAIKQAAGGTGHTIMVGGGEVFK
jgi:hypothetical protein